MEKKDKAKYIGKRYESDCTILRYEYKGYEYTVVTDCEYGADPVHLQHDTEQRKIDRKVKFEKMKGGC